MATLIRFPEAATRRTAGRASVHSSLIYFCPRKRNGLLRSEREDFRSGGAIQFFALVPPYSTTKGQFPLRRNLKNRLRQQMNPGHYKSNYKKPQLKLCTYIIFFGFVIVYSRAVHDTIFIFIQVSMFEFNLIIQ